MGNVCVHVLRLLVGLKGTGLFLTFKQKQVRVQKYTENRLNHKISIFKMIVHIW